MEITNTLIYGGIAPPRDLKLCTNTCGEMRQYCSVHARDSADGCAKRFPVAAHCKPVQVPVEELPREVSAYIQSQIPQMHSLGFEFLGCYDCGVLASNTRSFIAYFCNRTTNDFANVSVATSPQRTAGYFEFSTRFGTEWRWKRTRTAFYR